jgi:hypothetical protein
MKKALLRQFDRVARRTGRQPPTLNKARGDSFHVLEIAYLRVAYDSAVLYEEQFLTTSHFATDLDLIFAAASRRTWVDCFWNRRRVRPDYSASRRPCTGSSALRAA